MYGWIPEWPKGADCKSVGTAFEGSNPSPSTEEQKREPKYLWSKTKTVRILLHPPAAVAELADAQDLKSNGWIVKLWQIFLEKSRILKFHI